MEKRDVVNFIVNGAVLQEAKEVECVFEGRVVGGRGGKVFQSVVVKRVQKEADGKEKEKEEGEAIYTNMCKIFPKGKTCDTKRSAAGETAF